MGKCSKAAKSEVLFVFEDLGLDLGDKQTNLDSLTFRDLIGFLSERQQALHFKSLKLGFKSECSKTPEEWKRSIASGPDFEVAPNVLIENKCNLGNYLITPFMFIRDTLSRFIKRDPFHCMDWVLAVRKARWGKRVWELIRQFNIRVIETYGTGWFVKAKIRMLLYPRGTIPSATDRGYLPMEPIEPLKPSVPASSPVCIVKECWPPPDSTPNLSVSGSWVSSDCIENKISRGGLNG